MTSKPTYYDFVTFAYSIGFRWHSTGTLKSKEGKFGEYLEGDNISDEIKQSMVDKFGKWVSFHISQSQYAPERKRPMMTLLSKKAFERRQLQTA
jgi:hypothetical protein